MIHNTRSIKKLIKRIIPEFIRYHPFVDRLHLFLHPKLKYYLKKEAEIGKKAWEMGSLGPPKFALDIGANEGFHTGYFLKMGAKKIVSVEPDPSAFNILSQRYKRKKNVILLPFALGDKTGSFPFYRVAPASGYNTFIQNWFESYKQAESTILKIQMRTLDSIFKSYGIPDLIKVDAEGMEWEILKSLNQPIPMISFEANLPLFTEKTIHLINHLRKIMPNHNVCTSSGNQFHGIISWDEAIKSCFASNPICIEFFIIQKKN